MSKKLPESTQKAAVKKVLASLYFNKVVYFYYPITADIIVIYRQGYDKYRNIYT